ncbi:MAG: FtsX-like permease family protein [Lachnospiraceae bacterium]|nr:FtsX-like permease family protein [Lachnospiraceae bacterium]
MKNPLIRRIPKELASDWHKYLVIIVFMVVMIGVISGMYVGHDSMLEAVYSGREELNLEDGSFELTDKADEETLKTIEDGKKADVRTYYIDKATKEADEEVAKAIEDKLKEQVSAAIESGVRTQCAAFGITDESMIREMINTAMRENYSSALKTAKNSTDFKKAEEDAYKEAHEKVVEEVDKKWNEVSERYNLDDPKYFDVPVKIYENFYREEDEDVTGDGKKDATVRIFRSDSEINKATFLSGRAPEKDGEIAIDRMHADNRGVKVGDTIKVGGKEYSIVGLLSYVDYLTLHESNTDFMFDAFGFDVAMMTPDDFEALTSRIHYNYAFKYKTKPEDKNAKAEYSDSFRTMLITQSLVHDNELKDYLPEYLRQASNFAPNDIEGDSVGSSILCYILIGVIAFIFAVTISNTIEKEASVIGTLRASGYSKKELVVHYMSMPLIVTIIGAIVGNVLGYTAFKDVAVNLYYNSYSLPPCHSVWSTTALVKTTVIPLMLMFFINLIVIVKKLQLSPLKFLRHDLAKTKKTKARRLPSWKFIRRFRLRILFQNMPNYAILIFGVIFIELMLCFAFGLPDSLNKYAKDAPDMMFAEYQYMLMDSKDSDGNVITTSEESAEAFSSKSLMYPKSKDAFFAGRGSGGDEKVTVYGVKEDSKYVTLGSEAKDDNVFVSQAFINKFDLKIGDTITLKEEYENKDYTLKVAGIVDYTGGIAVFMDHKSFNKVFDYDDEDFSGYFSRNKITDIDSQDIAVVVTADDIIKVTVQLNHSMGGFMNVFKYALIVLSAAMIYLLAKIIIERNEQAISMVKILGFKNGEIGSLYIVPTAIVVTVCTVIGFVAGYFLMVWIFKVFMLQMDGYFAFYLSPLSMILSMLYLLIGYMLVSVIDYIRIKHIPMDVALKNVD